MKKGAPKVNLGFFKDGLKINSKKFHPLNMSLQGLKLESDKDYQPVDAMSLLDTLSAIDTENDTRSGRISALKTILNQVNPG